ncbi:uncharacterized protein LOC111312828 [Durio zibethinus]|uniref:Uncharacterized protein LOC111312828 n=1 Tax=Durio zibethinus TaxID=66656 RepID=A0A6P6AWT2_DURZI|nr:uncharacterized protein LOC111312828 [Durio zibethinus]
MSRCFPYPPPGYLRQGLDESIKLEKEKVLPKTEQKIHRKREKEKKKVGKEKEKTRGLTKKFKKLDDVLSGCKDEQLENSDLTEEHEAPVCYISDGSQNSNKRKRENQTLSSSQCRVDGNTIKIRFTLKKPREPDATLSKEPVCSTSGRSDSSTQPEAQEQRYPGSKKANTIIPVPEQKLWPNDERGKQIPSSSVISAYENEMQKASLLYTTLIEDWMPLPFQVEQNAVDDNDDDWLFMANHQGKPTAKRSKVDNNVTCRASASSCPRAHFLPEAEICALPYTVPF